MTKAVSEYSKFLPIQGTFNANAKTFKVGDVTINKIATGVFGWLWKVFGCAFGMKVSSNGKERTIYVSKSEANKILEALQKPEPSRDKISETFAKTLFEHVATIAQLENIGLNPEDLITLKAVVSSTKLKKLPPEITINEKIYTFNSAELPNGRFQFTFQEKDADPQALEGKTSLTINSEGKIVSIEVDNIPSTTLPEERRKIFNAYFLLSLDSSTKFDFDFENSRLHVSTLPSSPQHLPLAHLKFLGDSLKTTLSRKKKFWEERTEPLLFVTFLNGDLTRMEGEDRGGVRRAYLDQLFSGVAQHMLLQPFSTSKTAHGEPLAHVKDHRDEYEAIGRIYSLCGNEPHIVYDDTILTGIYFSNELFKLVFSLSYDECTQPLSAAARKRLNDLVLQSDSGKANATLAALSFCRDEGNISGLLDERFDKSQLIPMEKLATCKAEIEEKRTLVRTRRGSAKQAAQEEIDTLQKAYERSSHIMEMCAFVDKIAIYPKLYAMLQKAPSDRTDAENEIIRDLKRDLKNVTTDDYIDKEILNQGLDIEAIQAIGSGMISQRKFDPQAWDKFRNIPPSQYSDKVQGVGTKEKIAESIHQDKNYLQSPILNERIEWVKTWLTKEASEEEAKQFLKWATGATGLTPKGITFEMKELKSPYPIAHTCTSEVFLSYPNTVHSSKKAEYNTKKGFIKFLKEAMQNIDFSRT